MKLKVKNLSEVLKNLEKQTKEVISEVDIILTAGAKEIEGRAAILAPHDRGLLQGKIIMDPRNEFLRKVIAANTFYAPYMEFGTKGKFNDQGRPQIAAQFKGKSGKGGDFLKSIYDYLKRVGGFPPEAKTQAQKTAYAKFVMFKIAKAGVSPANKGQGFFFRAYDEIVPTIIKELKAALK